MVHANCKWQRGQYSVMRNKYCAYNTLLNEADVEQNFVRRLLEDLGYNDREIRPKDSLRALTIGGMRGRRQALYRPDFALLVNGSVRCLIEAKEPSANLDEHEWQVRAYAVLLNGEEPDVRSVRYYVLTNGTETRVYHTDRNKPLFTLPFTSFEDGTAKFDELRGLLNRSSIVTPVNRSMETLAMSRPTISDVNSAFSWCHQHIYKKDNISQSDAFSEFVKLISLKLLSDRRIRDLYPEVLEQDNFEIAASDVQFSQAWVKQNESNSSNPVSDILFRRFMDDMERDIARRTRKRIFRESDRINLRPETTLGVVRRLEKLFLFGIDADLNGRLFETFLNATMRGKDLGQFFTPRSLVKLGVRLAQLKVDVPMRDGTRHTDLVLDACCGTGGFLIDVLADMWAKVDTRIDLADDRKLSLKHQIANEAIVGVDIANAPILARIARLNMYLHGDGGTRIFHLNALDPYLEDADTDTPEIIHEKVELRHLFQNGSFDVVITNPPFAKALDRTTPEERRILDSFEIGRERTTATGSIRSVLLFLERYAQLLKDGGRMVTIVDDGILSGDDYRKFRDKLRSWFLIVAVISLPGDAFQRSNARVKTSYVVLQKRTSAAQLNPPVFMFPCQYVGNDDPKRQRPRAGDAELRGLAEREIGDVMASFEQFKQGVHDERYVVDATRIQDRLDVKNCLVSSGRQEANWATAGLNVYPLHEMLSERNFGDDDVITRDSPDPVTVMVVRYEGIAEAAEELNPADSSYAKLYPVRAGDIVISNIAASHGSIAVVPEELDGCVVSSEYTVLQASDGFDPIVVQIILRSPEIRSEILLSSSGANRTRTRWELIRNLHAPYPRPDVVQSVRHMVASAEAAKREAARLLEESRTTLEDALQLQTENALMILAAFKPPK
jgi:type I restriction enzyme M protein